MSAHVVLDASVLVELLLVTERSGAVKQAVAGAELVAPDVINLETAAALRRLERSGVLSTDRALHAIARLDSSPVIRIPTLELIMAAWWHRHNLTPYDAAYVALAQAMACSLVTADARMAGAPNLGVPVIVV